MTVHVNQAMIDWIAGDDRWEHSDITFSLNVDPGSFITEVIELFPFKFDPDVTFIPGTTVKGEFAAVLEGFELWDDLIPQTLTYSANDDDADITVNRVSNMPPYAGGLTYQTLHAIWPNDADVFLNGLTIQQGQYGFTSAIHEIGHALGLIHPGDYNASDGDPPDYAKDRMFDEDTVQFSIMSYFDASNYPGGGNWSAKRILTPMVYDILAIQQLYGKDTTTRKAIPLMASTPVPT
jgi:hypothetical protein